MSIDEGPFQNIVGAELDGVIMQGALTSTATRPHFYTIFQQGVPYISRSCATRCAAAYGFANRRQETAFSFSGWKGLGFEDPPYPEMALVGQSSGDARYWPIHCIGQLAGCWPFNEFNNFCVNDGVEGVARNNPSAKYGTPTILYALHQIEQGPDFSLGETVDITISLRPSTLPDPGPYTILSAAAHPVDGAAATVLTLDRDIRYASPSALCLVDAGGYSGMQAARAAADHASMGDDEITIEAAFTGTTTGSLSRVFDADYDIWHAYTSPSGPAPALPSGPCP